jgi:hypothetical protein
MKNNGTYTYTKEQLDNTKKAAQLITSVPEKEAAIFAAIANAYTDGFAAGCDFDTRVASR